MVTRRGFLATAAASLLLPKLQLVPQYDLHALAQKWCERDTWPTKRYDLTAPYVMGDHVYATDARAMVRFRDPWMHTDGEARIPRQTLEIWNGFWLPEPRWVPLPRRIETRNGDDGVCWKCHQRNVDCLACYGYGEQICLPGGYTVKCKTCNGLGVYHDPACDVCHGRYDLELPTVAVIDDRLFALEYVSLLRELPGVRLNYGCGDDSMPLLWESEIGLAGMIMSRTAA